MGPQVRPCGRGESKRETFPANPLNPVTVMAEVAEEPTGVAAGEVAKMLKFGGAGVTRSVMRRV